MTHATRTAALAAASYALIGFGLLMFTTLFTPTRVALDWFLDLAFLPFDGDPAASTPVGWLLTAICGGVTAGWGVMLLRTTKLVYAPDPALGRRLILPAIFVWFAVDGAGSVLSGAWFNVVLNGGFLVIFAAPILWPDRDGRERTA